MIPNSRRDNIIHLTDKQGYKSILIDSVAEQSDMEIRLKEFALNLLSKSEYSNWNKSVQIGHIEKVNDDVFVNSDDANVKILFEVSMKIRDLKIKVTEDNIKG
mgnify:CR=1 FL=1